MINYGKHFIDQSDIEAVSKTLRSNNLTQGNAVDQFENKIKSYFGSKYCVSTSSGTAALHLVMLALNSKKKDIIIATPMTFVASTNSVLYTKTSLELVDIDKDHLTICISSLKKKISQIQKRKKKIKAVIVTDYGGQPAEWKELKKLSKRHKFYLINDNCHAMGSTYFGDKKYAIKYADFVIQSYHPVKTFTTGEGGSVLTNNIEFYRKIKSLRSHGIIRGKKNYWKYEIKELGYNYRLSDIHASLGVSQLRKIDRFIKKRREIAKKYDKEFNNIDGLILTKKKPKNKNSYHLYFLRINFKKFKINKDQFLKELIKKKIKLQVHYVPIHYFELYKPIIKETFKNAEQYYDETVSLPIYYQLKKKDIEHVISSVKKILKI